MTFWRSAHGNACTVSAGGQGQEVGQRRKVTEGGGGLRAGERGNLDLDVVKCFVGKLYESR